MSDLRDIASKVFGIDKDEVTEELEYQSIPSWDSINHLELVTELESEFNVEFEMDDIIAMESIAKIRKILLSLSANLDDI